MAQLSSPGQWAGSRQETALRAGLWAEQFPFKGQAARWKTRTQPVSGLKKKRRQNSAEVKSRLGHVPCFGLPAPVCPWGVGAGISGPAGCCRAESAGRRQRCLPFPGLCPVSRVAWRRVPPLTFSGQGLAQSERSGKGTFCYLEQTRSWAGLAGPSENSRSEAAWLVCVFLKSSTETPGRERVHCRGQQTGQPGAGSASRPPLGKAGARTAL